MTCYTKGLSPVGVEPTTLGLLDPRSNQLSYGDLLQLWSTPQYKIPKYQTIADKSKSAKTLGKLTACRLVVKRQGMMSVLIYITRGRAISS